MGCGCDSKDCEQKSDQRLIWKIGGVVVLLAALWTIIMSQYDSIDESKFYKIPKAEITKEGKSYSIGGRNVTLSLQSNGEISLKVICSPPATECDQSLEHRDIGDYIFISK